MCSSITATNLKSSVLATYLVHVALLTLQQSVLKEADPECALSSSVFTDKIENIKGMNEAIIRRGLEDQYIVIPRPRYFMLQDRHR